MIRDLYDNSIVAYKTGTQQTVNLVLDTIRFAMRKENHNHRPCRWFAQAPLGHVPGRAYRLVESSANRADFPGMPLKGLILFAFFYRLTRKRVNVFFDTHLVIRIILL